MSDAATPATAPAADEPATGATASEVAAMLDTDPKTFRRFLRSGSSTFVPVGQGKRYSFDSRDIAAAKRLFPVWAAKHVRPAKPADDAAAVEAADAE